MHSASGLSKFRTQNDLHNAIAAAASLDVRTVVKFIAGGKVYPNVAERVAYAAEELGITITPAVIK